MRASLHAPPATGKILVLSPHLDDAVFSCGALIARQTQVRVATVFAGTPLAGNAVTEWDRASGFNNAPEAVAARRNEDREALQLLSAVPLWLDFLDGQYGASPTVPELADAFLHLIDAVQPVIVLLPAGLFHSDHLLVHRAALLVCRQRTGISWLMYEEALYRRVPGALQRCLAELQQARIRATPLPAAASSDESLKRAAVACYASQLRALDGMANGHADIFAAERYWQLDLEPIPDPAPAEDNDDALAA